MHLSVIVPAFNEAARLPQTVTTLRHYLIGRQRDWEILLVDDGSHDGTRAIVEAAARADARVHAVVRATNGGKGAAVRDGVRRASGRIVVFLDADLAHPPEAIDTAVARIEAGADLAVGARDLVPGGRRHAEAAWRRVGALAFNVCVETLLHLGVADTQCGFKALRADVASALFEQLTIDRFAFDIELFVLARSWGLRIDRIPIAVVPTRGSSVSLVGDVPRMLRDVWRIRQNVRRNLYHVREQTFGREAAQEGGFGGSPLP